MSLEFIESNAAIKSALKAEMEASAKLRADLATERQNVETAGNNARFYSARCCDLEEQLVTERAGIEQGVRSHASMAAQLAKVCEERDYLVNAIEFMRGYKGLEARGCVLCIYENGVFKKSCQMHSDLDRIEKGLATERTARESAERKYALLMGRKDIHREDCHFKPDNTCECFDEIDAHDASLTEPLERRVAELERALVSEAGKYCGLCQPNSAIYGSTWEPIPLLIDGRWMHPRKDGRATQSPCGSPDIRAALASTPREGTEEPYVVVDTSEDWEARGWPEDFNHENGQYSNWCVSCKLLFVGHKRRVVCRVCTTKSEQPVEPPLDDLTFARTAGWRVGMLEAAKLADKMRASEIAAEIRGAVLSRGCPLPVEPPVDREQDRKWITEMAAKEDGCIVSVGGLVGGLQDREQVRREVLNSVADHLIRKYGADAELGVADVAILLRRLADSGGTGNG